jgi:hypothetical protein
LSSAELPSASLFIATPAPGSRHQALPLRASFLSLCADICPLQKLIYFFACLCDVTVVPAFSVLLRKEPRSIRSARFILFRLSILPFCPHVSWTQSGIENPHFGHPLCKVFLLASMSLCVPHYLAEPLIFHTDQYHCI